MAEGLELLPAAGPRVLLVSAGGRGLHPVHDIPEPSAAALLRGGGVLFSVCAGDGHGSALVGCKEGLGGRQPGESTSEFRKREEGGMESIRRGCVARLIAGGGCDRHLRECRVDAKFRPAPRIYAGPRGRKADAL